MSKGLGPAATVFVFNFVLHCFEFHNKLTFNVIAVFTRIMYTIRQLMCVCVYVPYASATIFWYGYGGSLFYDNIDYLNKWKYLLTEYDCIYRLACNKKKSSLLFLRLFLS